MDHGTHFATIYLTQGVRVWVAWDGYTWSEDDGAVMDPDRHRAVERYQARLLERRGILDAHRVEWTIIVED